MLVLEANSCVYVKFPYPFNLDLYNPSSVTCSAHYDGDADDVDFIEAGDCEVEDNFVKVDLASAKEITSEYWTTFYFEGIVTPDTGLSRDSQYDEEDEDYDFWTGKVSLFFLEADQTEVTQCDFDGRSYSNINAAYTGFYESSYEPI
ncbi:hypothetical protein RAG09_29145 [Klebsiella pneumoniae]